MLTEEELAKLDMFKRVLAFFQMHKDIISENREIMQTVESLRSDIIEMCEIILSSDESSKEDLEAVKGMQSMLEFTKQFGAWKRN